MRETPRREKVVPVSGAVAPSPLSKKVTLRAPPLSLKDVVSGSPSASPERPGPNSLVTNSWSVERVNTALVKSAASGSVQNCPELGETPVRAIVQLSAKLKVTLRGFPFKVAVSDVEEFSVMTRVLITPARIGWVTSPAVIATISAGNIFRVDLDIIFPYC